MVKLSFDRTSIDSFRSRRDSYIQSFSSLEEFKESELKVFSRVIQALDLKDIDDAFYFSYLLWHTSYSKSWVKTNAVKGYAYFVCEQLKHLVPGLDVVGGPGIYDVGYRSRKPVAHSTIATAYYSCLKFFGQYTINQDIYDMCVQTLERLPKTLEGPIAEPPEVLYWLTFNDNVDTSQNKQRAAPDDIFNSGLKYSIFRPNPSFSIEGQREDKEFILVSTQIALEQGTELSWVVLTSFVVHSKYPVLDDTDHLDWFVRFKGLQPELLSQLSETLIKISSSLN